ncbi:MAG: ParA family protein [Gammaproteobacteria bacterium]|nr:ParA family protein [Gammaproteobacteria bacterium]MDE0271820.1 ParA family protein [Gammaproteobacteria bacterium]
MKTRTVETPRSGHCHRILVVNAKGGCGKTTLATNLCAAYAARGVSVALVDNDGQGSGAHWTAQRPADAPLVELASGGRPALDRVIIDGLVPGSELETGELVAMADLILVPMLPSAIDIRAGERFITALMTRPEFRAAPLPVGVIANRVQHNTPAQAHLMHFLGCLNVPVAVTLRDSPLYGEAMGAGLGVADLFDVRAARKEMTAWRALIHWVEAQLPSRAAQPRPLAAGRPSREARHGMPERARLVSGSQGPAAAGGSKGPQPHRLSA